MIRRDFTGTGVLAAIATIGDRTVVLVSNSLSDAEAERAEQDMRDEYEWGDD